ncbi:MFS transporter [Lactimicrobium massiliense]|uniref:MFS transporter n=1 Tax=Lactimicrobium massiliense TaxID=2161814 RepID=UPI0014355E26|nr:MFS transporter [Lactimicrobium massiliense]
MMRSYSYLNAKYALVSAAYMMLVVAVGGYAYNFLSQSGLSDGMAGTVITCVSLTGLILQTVFGSVIDSSEKLSEKSFISLTMILAAVLAIVLLFVKNTIFLCILVICCFTMCTSGFPFFNSLAFAYEKQGHAINYGIGRGIGSAAYAVGSSLLGTLWGHYGKAVMPWYLLVFALITWTLMQMMPDPVHERNQEKKTENTGYIRFFHKYRRILLPAAAMIMLYFCHMLVNTYLAKIIASIIGAQQAGTAGTVEGFQGTALFIQAMCELPTMFVFAWLMKKASVNRLMIFSAVIYSLKHAIILFASNIGMLYFAMVLQMLSYAILVPGSVYFANEIVSGEDRNKGQAVMAATTTVGGLLSSFIGGQLFQHFDVHTVIAIGTAVSMIGTILMIAGITKIEKKS